MKRKIFAFVALFALILTGCSGVGSEAKGEEDKEASNKKSGNEYSEEYLNHLDYINEHMGNVFSKIYDISLANREMLKLNEEKVVEIRDLANVIEDISGDKLGEIFSETDSYTADIVAQPNDPVRVLKQMEKVYKEKGYISSIDDSMLEFKNGISDLEKYSNRNQQLQALYQDIYSALEEWNSLVFYMEDDLSEDNYNEALSYYIGMRDAYFEAFDILD